MTDLSRPINEQQGEGQNPDCVYRRQSDRSIRCSAVRDGSWRREVRMECLLPVGHWTVYRPSRDLLFPAKSNGRTSVRRLRDGGDGASLHLLVLYQRDVVFGLVY